MKEVQILHVYPINLELSHFHGLLTIRVVILDYQMRARAIHDAWRVMVSTR